MAYCDVCGNYDKSHVEDIKENVSTVPDEDYQPDLYYYWDAPLEENYDWRDEFPLVDCMCEICFDIAQSEGKIKWTNSTDPFLLEMHGSDDDPTDNYV